MTPDMKRLCEAAAGAGFRPGQHTICGRPEAIVRAVLVALREPSDGLIDALDPSLFPHKDWYGHFWGTMLEAILAEPAKA